jgi:hypothetical protein
MGLGMTQELLEQAGKALYGALWQGAIARDLGIADRAVRRWTVEHYPIPERVRTNLIGIVSNHIEQLQLVRRQLEE